MRFNKNYKRGLFLLFLLLIIFSGISIIKNVPTTDSFDDNDISTSQPDDPYEPNDDFGSARDINSENLKWLKLIQEDEDWFKFDVFPNFDRLIVKVLFLNWEGDIDIELYDQFYTYITGSYSTDDGEFLDYIVSSGSYHLRIYGPNWRQPYELLWNAINSSVVYDDYYEPNNNDIEAGINADLSFNKGEWLSEINGLGIQFNFDYFKIDVDPTNRRLFVEVIFSSFFGNIDVDIYDSSLSWVTGSYSFNHNEFINFELPSSGIYYIVVYGSNARNTYDLRWDTGPVEDNYETNNDRFQATDLTSYNDWHLSWISGPGIQREDDWYKISVNPTEKWLRVDVKFKYPFGDIDIEIYDEWGGWITASWEERNGEFIDYVLPSGGIYYIRITGDNNGNIYDFFWEALSNDDWMEDNDDFYSAWPIEPMYYPDLRIVEYDEDWFRIDLNPDDIIDIRIYFNNFDGDLQLELYDPYDSYVPRDRSESTDDDEYISFTADESGGWRIHIYRVSGDSNVDVWYHLEIWVNGEQAGVDPYEYNDNFHEAYDLRDDEYTWLSDIHGVAVQENEDWYMIDITPGFRHLMVNLSLTYGFGNIWFSIHDEQGFDIDYSYSVPYGEHIDFIVSRPGIYFIKIWGYNTGIEYDLWWDDLRTDTRDDDNYEENDDPSNAYDLSTHQYEDLWQVDGSAIQRDNDWYKIFITSGFEHLFVFVTYDYQEGPIGIEIYDGDISKVTGNFTNEDNELISYDLPSNGTYYIRIHGYHSGNIYSLRWETWETYIEEMIPGYDVVIILGAIFGVAVVITLKWKRSKKHF